MKPLVQREERDFDDKAAAPEDATGQTWDPYRFSPEHNKFGDWARRYPADAYSYDVEATNPEAASEAALDIFHGTVPIACLEHFDIETTVTQVTAEEVRDAEIAGIIAYDLAYESRLPPDAKAP